MRALILLCCAIHAAFAQTTRESYRAPFQAWRDAAPNLEQDAAAPGPEFSEQAVAAAQAAQTFLAARAAYLATGQGATSDQIQWASRGLIHGNTLLAVPADTVQLLGKASDYLNNTINSFANVRDPAIQQVRGAMERERVALAALQQALRVRGDGVRELVDAGDEAEAARAAVAQAILTTQAAREQVAEHVRREAADWARYYRDLSEGAAATVRAAPGTLVTTAPQPSPRTGAAVPLSRYTGSWAFAPKGLFHGAEPQAVELIVSEDSGRLSGSLAARFVLPAGSPGDPNLRLTFQGLMLQSRTQSFPVQTDDGRSGTIELIPGPAFNLLEVNIQLDGAVNKIGAANFVLLKR